MPSSALVHLWGPGSTSCLVCSLMFMSLHMKFTFTGTTGLDIEVAAAEWTM